MIIIFLTCNYHFGTLNKLSKEELLEFAKATNHYQPQEVQIYNMVSPNHNGLPKAMNNANDFANDANDMCLSFDDSWTFAVDTNEEAYLSIPLLNKNDYNQIRNKLLWE